MIVHGELYRYDGEVLDEHQKSIATYCITEAASVSC